MAQLHARGELALGEDFVNESVIGTRFTGRLVEETTVGGAPGGRARDHRPRLDHRHGPVPARRRATRSRPASPCEAARWRSSAPASSAPRSRASWTSAASTSRCSTAARCRAARPGWARATCCARDKDAGPELELTLAGLALYDELEERLGEEARIRRKGALIVHRDDADVGGRARRGASACAPPGVQGACSTLDEVRAMEPELTGALAGASFFPADLQCAPRAIARALRRAACRACTPASRSHGVAVERDRVTGAAHERRRRCRATAVGHRRRAVEPRRWPRRRASRCRSSRARASSSAWPPRRATSASSATRSSRRATWARSRAPTRACRSPRCSRRRGRATCSSARAASGAASTSPSTTRVSARHARARLRAHARPARAAGRRRVGRAAAVAARPPARDRAVAAPCRGCGSPPATRAPASRSAPSPGAWSPSSTRARRRSSTRRRSRPIASDPEQSDGPGGLPSGPSLRLLKGGSPSAPPGLRARGPQTLRSHPRRRPVPPQRVVAGVGSIPTPRLRGGRPRAPSGCVRPPRRGRSPLVRSWVGLLVARSHTVLGAGPWRAGSRAVCERPLALRPRLAAGLPCADSDRGPW